MRLWIFGSKHRKQETVNGDALDQEGTALLNALKRGEQQAIEVVVSRMDDVTPAPEAIRQRVRELKHAAGST